MQKKLLNAGVCFAITLMAGFGTTANAQQSKTLEEVKIKNEESFSYVKSLIAQNFDFTNPELKPGDANALLKFEVGDNGKIVNVKAEGRDEEFNKEIVHSLSGIIYRAPFKNSPYVYVVPVNLHLATR